MNFRKNRHFIFRMLISIGPVLLCGMNGPMELEGFGSQLFQSTGREGLDHIAKELTKEMMSNLLWKNFVVG